MFTQKTAYEVRISDWSSDVCSSDLDGVEPSVSTVIDGVVIGRSAASFFDFNDIERIEVLRGPQGTLFGKNSSAGALNVVTGKPDLYDSSLEASASYGTFDDVRLKATGSVVLDQIGRAACRERVCRDV